MKINKIYVKSKNTRYTIIIGKGSLGILKKQLNKLCPRTKKVGLILDKNIPNNFKLKNNSKNTMFMFMNFFLMKD